MSPTLRLGAGVALVCLAASLGLAPLDRVAEDAWVRVATRLHAFSGAVAPPGHEAIVVAIDARSLRAFDEWPWSRAVLAAAIDEIDAAGGEGVLVDVDLSTARDASGDAALARAIARHGRVGLAVLRQFEVIDGLGEMEFVSRPLPRFIEAGARLGHVLVPVDPDGVVRRAHGTNEVGGVQTPALADLAFRFGEGANETRDAGPRGPHRIDFRFAEHAIPVVSIADVVERRYEPGLLAGKTVFIGATALELQDLWPTPMHAAMPGVVLQAIDYRTLQAERAGLPVLSRPSGLAAVAALLVFVAGGWVNGRVREHRSLAHAGVALGALALSGASVTWGGWLFSPLLALVAAGGQLVAGIEAVRQRMGIDLAARERSLATVLQVGERTARTEESDDPLEASLTLLADVVGARGAALLRTTPGGRWDERRLDWSPDGHRVQVEPEVADDSLAQRQVRVLERTAGVTVHAPLWVGDTPVGLLALDCAHRRLDDVQLRTVATVASQMALSARNMRLVEDLQDTLASSVEAIASAVEARDGYTEMHCRRLALFSVSMARRMAFSDEEIDGIRLGALLHDVGKIGVRDEILLKPGRFSDAERLAMQRHVEIGHRIVRPIHGLTPCTLHCVRHHHEKWDGTGYPDALAGDAIPVEARIVSIVDVWDALSTARPYKKAFEQSRVVEILEKDRGTHFDPELLDLFFHVLDEEGDEMLALVAKSAGGKR